MKYRVTHKQENYSQCVVCGYDNPLSLEAVFYELENNEVVCLFTAKDQHQSYPGRMHGGMISAILDETIGRAVKGLDAAIWAVTVDLRVKYRKPTPLGVELKCVGRIISHRSRMFRGTGEIYLPDGTVCAEAQIDYVKVKMDKVVDPAYIEADMRYLPDETPVTEIELYDNETENQRRNR